MVLDWGMGESLGCTSLGDDRQHAFLGEEIGQQRPYSEATAREIDEEVRAILSWTRRTNGYCSSAEMRSIAWPRH
jgi:cell division protease FtsH